jgi:hypothetical protein
MLVDRVIDGQKIPLSPAIVRPETAETHSSAAVFAHTICALAGMGIITSTSCEAKVRSEDRIYNLQLSCQQLFTNYLKKVHSP